MKGKFFLAICITIAISGCSKENINSTQSQVQNTTSPVSMLPTPTPTSANKTDSPKGYLLVNNSEVLFIRWTEADKKLSGQLQMFFTQINKDKRENDSSTHSFTGVIDKENISLNFTGSVWTDGLGGNTWTGTLKDKNLTLIIPNKDGKLNTFVFQSATVEDYNSAVSNIQNKVADDNQRIDIQKAQAIQAQAQADKLATEQNAVKNANQKLANNIGVLNNSIKNSVNIKRFDDILTSYNTHWKSMQDNYQKLKSHTSKNPLTSDDIYQGNSDLYNMNSDRYNISSDVSVKS